MKKIKWDYFLTIPLPHRTGIHIQAPKIWKGFFERVVTTQKLHPRNVLWAVVLEFGPSEENPHFHALMSGPNRKRESAQTIEAFILVGKKMGLPGTVDVRVYRSGLNTAEYMCKEQNSPYFNHPALHDGSWPMISGSAWKALHRHPDTR